MSPAAAKAAVVEQTLGRACDRGRLAKRTCDVRRVSLVDAATPATRTPVTSGAATPSGCVGTVWGISGKNPTSGGSTPTLLHREWPNDAPAELTLDQESRCSLQVGAESALHPALHSIRQVTASRASKSGAIARAVNETGILPDFAYAQRTPDKREVGRSTRPRPIETEYNAPLSVSALGGASCIRAKG